METGESTGADTKGVKSGNIYVMDTEAYPLWDIRVAHEDETSRSELAPSISPAHRW